MRAFGVSSSVAFALAVAFGCGPEPEGVEDCRAIERARCQAAARCGVIDDAERCERFFRDHCLHGLEVDSPGARAVDACVEAIEETTSDECEAALEPERLPACGFLDPSSDEPEEEEEEPEPEPEGSAGASGTDSGGAGGGDASG